MRVVAPTTVMGYRVKGTQMSQWAVFTQPIGYSSVKPGMMEIRPILHKLVSEHRVTVAIVARDRFPSTFLRFFLFAA